MAVNIKQWAKKKGDADKTPVGTGDRFEKLTNDLEEEGKDEESAKSIAAYIGRKKYGAKKMAAMAAASKKGSE
jgi:hypothetical protein